MDIGPWGWNVGVLGWCIEVVHRYARIICKNGTQVCWDIFILGCYPGMQSSLEVDRDGTGRCYTGLVPGHTGMVHILDGT